MDNNEKKIINTIHERDLDSLLEKFGLKDKLYNGSIKCEFCEKNINRENLYSIFKELGEIKLVCDSSECITKMLSYVEEKKKAKINN